jgi:hypothetical protein
MKKLSKFSPQPSFIYLIATITLIISLGIIYYSVKPTSGPSEISLGNPRDQQFYDKWAGRIKKIGGEKAYTQFVQETSKKALRDRHHDAHLFGEALYNSEGKKGISVCDNRFDYGCYHSFMGLAIYTEGVDTVPDLSNKCVEVLGESSGGCQHGIGHGILSFFGYSLDDLNKSTDICSKLKTHDLTAACLHGVFMEYNFQTMLLSDGKIRDFNNRDPYYPCSIIGSNAKNVCFNQQAQWWIVSIKEPFNTRVQQIDQLCSQLPTEPFRSECFKGFGIKLIAYLGYNETKAKKVCDSLKDSGKTMCRSGIASNSPLN